MAKKLLGASAIALCMAATPARAEYIQTLGVDEECVSVGGACVAREASLGAYYVNPALAADFDRPRIGFNARVIDTRDLKLIDPAGNHDIPRTNTKGKIAVAPTIAGYVPLSDRVTVGVGVGAPFAITADWTNADGVHRYNMSDQSLFVLDVAPTVAFKVSDRLSIGLTASITAFKQLRTETLIPLSFGAALPPALGGAGVVTPTGPNDPIIGSITLQTSRNLGIGLPPDGVQAEFGEGALVVGAAYRLSDAVRLGVAYRTKTKTTFTGETTLVVGPTTQRAPFSLTLDMPAHIQAGISATLRPGTVFSADYQRTFWSKARGFGDKPAIIRFAQPLLGFINDLQVDYGARDASTVRFGLSQQVGSRLQIRGGYAFDEHVFSDRAVDILTYDSDRSIWSAGLRYDARTTSGRGFIVNASYQVADYLRRSIPTGVSRNLGGVSLPNLRDADTLGFVPNRTPFTFDGAIRSFSVGAQYVF